MKPLAQASNDNLTEEYHASQVLIAEVEARLVQLADQLLVANASLEREIADRKRTEDEFRRSTDQLRELPARLQSVREEECTPTARVIHKDFTGNSRLKKMELFLDASLKLHKERNDQSTHRR